jgi:hypothetical protein
MPYVFTRTADYVIIEHAIDGLLITTRLSATIAKSASTISIIGIGYNLNCPISDIGTIDGVTPSDGNQAALLLGKLFKGYPPFKITIE